MLTVFFQHPKEEAHTKLQRLPSILIELALTAEVDLQRIKVNSPKSQHKFQHWTLHVMKEIKQAN